MGEEETEEEEEEEDAISVSPPPYLLYPLALPSAGLADITEMVLQLQGTMMKMENFQKLLELKKDLTGIDNLAVRGRVRPFTFIIIII